MRETKLLLDDRLIRAKENVALELGRVRKEASNPLLAEQYFADPPKRWETRIDNMYPNVMYDDADGLFKLWYTCFVIDEVSAATPLSARPHQPYAGYRNREMAVLYAYSRDGLEWVKPDLGIVEFDGSKRNNIVLRGVHGAGVFKDTHETNPRRRYKMFMKHGERGPDAMAVSFSPDGLRWEPPTPWPRHNARGDTHNNAFYDGRSGQYIAFTREWIDGVRVVARTQSSNFTDWTKPEVVLAGNDPHAQVYSMPVFPYGDIYIGLPAIFHTDQDAPDFDSVTCELAWSPDTVEWHRVCPGQSFITLGAGSYPTGDADCGAIYASVPVFRGDEMNLYYGGGNGRHTAFRETSLLLARLGADRFAGYRAADPNRPGRIAVHYRHEDCPDGELHVTAEIGEGGYVKAALTDRNGNELPGCGFADCAAVRRSGTDVPIRWSRGALPAAGPEEMAIVFEVAGRNSVLYAYFIG
ncbi:MAG: hypothetical protein J7639_14470 [Paenibacillaceae bacterium]|nr:hypothetical protein [Paenibacillaceae bacterium]